MNEWVKSGLWRAARTFLSTFLATLSAGPLLDVHVATVKLAAVAGVSAVLSMVQRALDETPVPSLPKG